MLGCEAYKDYVGEKAKRRRYHHSETRVVKKDQAIDDTGGAPQRKLQTLEGE